MKRNAVDLDVPPATAYDATLREGPPLGAELGPTIKDRRTVERDCPLEATVKDRRTVERDCPLEATVKDRRTSERDLPLPDAEATIKDRRAVDREVPPAAPLDATLNERNGAATRHVPPAAPFEATLKERSGAGTRHVPLAAPFEATFKERSAAARSVPPRPSESPTLQSSGWLTWWLTSRPNESSAPAESSANAQPAPTGTPIKRSGRTWIVVALIVAAVGGTVAFIYGSTNDSATKTTNRDTIGGDQ